MSDSCVIKDIQNAVTTPEILNDLMCRNMGTLLCRHDIASIYAQLRGVEVTEDWSPLSRLILCWMSFLSGDNARLTALFCSIDEGLLSDAQTSSMFYSLKALSGLGCNPEDRTKYARMAIDILRDEGVSLVAANARLTYAQILAGNERYRDASEGFSSAHAMFYKLRFPFPAAVAVTNEALNLHRLGELDLVIDLCSKKLSGVSSFIDGTPLFWEMLHLPLGMSYYELDKQELALSHLNIAKACIDSLRLLHMHGLIEVALFRCYQSLKDATGMDGVIADAVSRYGNMHLNPFNSVISAMRVLAGLHTGDLPPKSDLERLEVDFKRSPSKIQQICLDALVLGCQRSQLPVITLEDLGTFLDHFRYTGDIPRQQSVLLLIASIHDLASRDKEANGYIEEAMRLRRDTGVCASFRTIGTSDSATRNKSINGKLLSERELEILCLIAKGLSNEEISKTLYIGIGTIKWHTNNIFSKLHVKNRIQAVEKAKELREI